MAVPDAENGRSPSASAENSGDEQEGFDDTVESQPREEMGTQTGSKGMNAKDHLRPRRKKARRACYACQRAHLTCGTSEQYDLSPIFIQLTKPCR